MAYFLCCQLPPMTLLGHMLVQFFQFLLLQILEEEVRAYDNVVEELSREANRLIGDGHFDCSNITARQVCAYVCLCL